MLPAEIRKVLWDTYYTPLNFLMIPYRDSVINILLPVNLDFYPFYFPSILIWSIGLIIFFIPSLLLGLIYNKHKPEEKKEFPDPATFKSLYIIGSVLLVFTLFYIYRKTLTLEEIIGSDEFASETLARGVWAHIREVLLAVMILSIYLVNKNRAWLFILIFGVLIVSSHIRLKDGLLFLFSGNYHETDCQKPF